MKRNIRYSYSIFPGILFIIACIGQSINQTESKSAVMALQLANLAANVRNVTMALKECTKIHGSPPGERSLGKRVCRQREITKGVGLIDLIGEDNRVSIELVTRSSLDKYFCET